MFCKSDLPTRDLRVGSTKNLEIFNAVQKFTANYPLQKKDQLRLHKIVALGQQSAGKSTFLNNAVGSCILPRGSGIVTRTPIWTLLRHTSSNTERITVNGQLCSSTKEVQEKITQISHGLTEGNKKISKTPIIVEIESNKVVDLNFSDLPGVISIAVKGETTDDDIENIRKIVESEISNPETIILAILDAGVDLANNEPLNLAKKYDPELKRTIGVLTKMDTVSDSEKIENITKALRGEKINFGLGCFGVSCFKFQDDLELPEDYFSMEMEVYKKYPDDVKSKLGLQNLLTALEKIHEEQVKRQLPNILKEIDAQYCSKIRTRKNLGKINSDIQHPKIFLLDVVSTYVSIFTSILNYELDKNTLCLQNLDLKIGLRIQECITAFKEEITKVNPLSKFNEEVISEQIKLSEGWKAPFLLEKKPIKQILASVISELKEPTLILCNKVERELQCLNEQTLANMNQDLSAFKNLKELIRRVVKDLIKNKIKDCISIIYGQIEVISREHDFSEVSYKPETEVKGLNPGPETSDFAGNKAQIAKKAISCYFEEIVKKQFRLFVPGNLR